MNLEDYLTDYITEKELIIADEDFVVLTTVDTFCALGVDTDDINDCIKKASIQQLYYVSNNIDRFKGENNLKSIRVSNYSVTYNDSKGILSYVSPLAYQILVRCGLITMTTQKVEHCCGIFK